MGSIPFIARKNTNSLQDREGKLTATQRQRGMYVPAGVQDAGIDPDWDIKERKWKGWERKQKLKQSTESQSPQKTEEQQ